MSRLPIQILYESRNYVAVNKPAKVAMQGTPYSPAGKAWQEFRQDIQNRVGAKGPLHVVHRLDAGTSGVLILAKTTRAAFGLSQQFEKRQISKEYLAIVKSGTGRHGARELQEGQAGFIDARLKVTDEDVQLCFPDEGDARCKDTRTKWQHIVSNGPFSLLKLHPETGRKHQIRVHCSKVLSAPVVGDFKYGYLGSQIVGHLLHCHSISFCEWGVDGKRKTIGVTAALPTTFVEFAQRHALQMATNAFETMPL